MALFVFGQDGKKVQFVGGARSLISHNNFSSDAEDTVTARKNTGGDDRKSDGGGSYGGRKKY